MKMHHLIKLLFVLALSTAVLAQMSQHEFEFLRQREASINNPLPAQMAYFAQWGIYGRGYKVKNIDTSGVGYMLTHINYAFGNIYKQADGSFKCGIINKLEAGNGDGGDAWADYQKGFSASESVDGVGDEWGFKWDDPRNGKMGPLKGSFNQFQKLKVKYPGMKVLISLGGWTWSKYFSVAASTDYNRKTLVSSCIDIYIKGNIPFDSGSNAGGAGMAAGVFDGVDIDWEYPGGGGLETNIFNKVTDKDNFTLLLKEFREQLDTYGKSIGQYYELTIAAPAGVDKISNSDPKNYHQYLDRINIMSYDFRGAWKATGPTNHQANLLIAKDDVSDDIIERTYAIGSAVDSFINSGVPAKKLQIGIPYYGRGWTGVAPGPGGHGLYQKATGPARGTYEAGVEDYKIIKELPGKRYKCDQVGAIWFYDGNTFWSYDDEYVIAQKIAYMKSKGLGGAFAWSLDGDDAQGTLSRAVFNNLRK